MRNVECIGKSSLSGPGKFLFFGGPMLVLSLLAGCNGSGLPVGDVGDAGPGTGGKASGSGGATSGSGGSTSGSGGSSGSGGGGEMGGQSGTGGKGNPGMTCGGIAGLPCPSDQYCHFKDGECRTIADVGGVCASKPQGCTADFAPVCGCDNKTYSNSCAAAAAGVSVGATGACNAPPDAGTKGDAGTKADAAPTGKTCGGLLGTPCSTGEFCRFPTGQCQIADNQGQCTSKQVACIAAVGMPVCGCDGKTYTDDCAAIIAGQSVKSTGACP